MTDDGLKAIGSGILWGLIIHALLTSYPSNITITHKEYKPIFQKWFSEQNETAEKVLCGDDKKGEK